LSLHGLGETSGSQTVSLLQSEMPAHNHNANCVSNTAGDQNDPTVNALWSKTAGSGRQPGAPDYETTGVPAVQMNPSAIAVAGGDQPHNNMSPYLTVTFIIALQGVYPPRT
jgi:microcystin-dependent protein